MSIIKDKYEKYSTANESVPQRSGFGSESLNNSTFTYHGIWRTLGSLGLFLPLGLIALTSFKGEEILPSISDYYYSELNVIFIGAICCIAIFLWHYKGEEPNENYLTRFASICALCVAWFPTNIISGKVINQDYNYNINDFYSFVSPQVSRPEFESLIHYITAGCFFISLGALVLTYFTKSEKNGDNLNWRINTYKVCGIGIIFSILAIIAISIIFEDEEFWAFPATFTLETIALALFGIAWLIKGKTDQLKSIRIIQEKLSQKIGK